MCSLNTSSYHTKNQDLIEKVALNIEVVLVPVKFCVCDRLRACLPNMKKAQDMYRFSPMVEFDESK